MNPLDLPNSPHRGDDGDTSPNLTSPNGVLKPDSILIEEFSYASVTAYQAMEDRSRLLNLYLLICVGGGASALTALYQLGTTALSFLQPLACLALLVTGLLGVVFFMNIIRLRQAFLGSLRAMNDVKEYYIRHLRAQLPDIDDAFLWRKASMPKGERAGSVTFLICFVVSILGSLSFAGAVTIAVSYIIQQQWFSLPTTAVARELTLLFAAGICIVSLLLHTRYYRRQLMAR